jgi:thiamine pyrophosphate-dependent acetolactate synthase large subunit-like protein
MRIRPDKEDVERVARLLVEARNPLITIGDDVTWCHAEQGAVELAEKLGIPVVSQAAASAGVKRRKQDWPVIVTNMIDRGAAATADEAQAIAAYLTANFGAD